MDLDRRIDRAWQKLKAPEGKWVVCVWDPSNPSKSIPMQVSEPYNVRAFAKAYADRRQQMYREERDAATAEGKPWIGETEYFVVNDRGSRIF